MKKFLVLYVSSVSAREQMAKMSPEQSKAGMEMWMAWAKKAGAAIVDLGSPVGDTTQVTSSGASKVDGNYGGFSILQAESAKALHEVLKGHPHFMMPGASIEVHEFIPIPGM
jgi:hypothetical protein